VSAHLDHLIVPARNAEAAARQLAELLGVAWGRAHVGPFMAVYVNEGLTLDFDEWTGALPKGHYCFRVSEGEFDAILGRLVSSGIPYRSLPHGPADHQVNTSLGSRIVYWAEPDGHVWELLTRSYSRASGPGPGPSHT
jgi:catechol 2,3-dioxygenase-like lactoylglutathione lyase family enzyme